MKPCKTCGRYNCTGFYLLHEKELDKVDEIKQKELSENANVQFDMMLSQSSGEIFTQFYELHVLCEQTAIKNWKIPVEMCPTGKQTGQEFEGTQLLHGDRVVVAGMPAPFAVVGADQTTKRLALFWMSKSGVTIQWWLDSRPLLRRFTKEQEDSKSYKMWLESGSALGR